ncbi:hypothetical protein ACJX0J_023944, partial [Zea mays]
LRILLASKIPAFQMSENYALLSMKKGGNWILSATIMKIRKKAAIMQDNSINSATIMIIQLIHKKWKKGEVRFSRETSIIILEKLDAHSLHIKKITRDLQSNFCDTHLIYQLYKQTRVQR